MEMITADRVVEAFVKTRDEITQKEKELEESLKPLKDLQEKREQWLLAEIQKTGLKNLPTKHGTAYVTRRESVTCADWDTFVAENIILPIARTFMKLEQPDATDEEIDAAVRAAHALETPEGSLWDIIAQAGKWELLEHRVAKTAALEIMGEERQNPPPPGTSYSAINKIGVRKS